MADQHQGVMQALMVQGDFLEQAHMLRLSIQIRMQIAQRIDPRLIGDANLPQHGIRLDGVFLAGTLFQLQPAQAIHRIPAEYRPPLSHPQTANQIQRPQLLPGFNHHNGVAGFEQHFQVVKITHG